MSSNKQDPQPKHNWPHHHVPTEVLSKDSPPIQQDKIADSPLDSKPIDVIASVPDQTDPHETTPKKHQKKQKSVKVSSDSINFRKEASKNSDVLFRVTSGTILTVLEDQGDWLMVSDSQGRKGFVMAQFTETAE